MLCWLGRCCSGRPTVTALIRDCDTVLGTQRIILVRSAPGRCHGQGACSFRRSDDQVSQLRARFADVSKSLCGSVGVRGLRPHPGRLLWPSALVWRLPGVVGAREANDGPRGMRSAAVREVSGTYTAGRGGCAATSTMSWPQAAGGDDLRRTGDGSTGLRTTDAISLAAVSTP